MAGGLFQFGIGSDRRPLPVGVGFPGAGPANQKLRRAIKASEVVGHVAVKNDDSAQANLVMVHLF